MTHADGRVSIKKLEDYRRQMDEYTRLRELVLGDEYEAALKQYISGEDDVRRVSEVISEAISRRQSLDHSLADSLAPVVDQAIQTSIDENPKRITNVIFPILGPAVRKAVAAALSDMVQSLNSLLEQSLNFKSLRWRIQAMRSGVPYAQYVLLHTLKFRVEQVLLVHRKTGLLLHSVSLREIQIQDPELVSSMLTAITDFMSDSFSQGESDTLEGIRFGDLLLHIEVGPEIVLAAAVRGTMSEHARSVLSTTLEEIHTNFSADIEKFNGDREIFEATDELLQHCLLTQTVDEDKPARKPWIALLCIGIFIGYIAYKSLEGYWLSLEKASVIEAVQSEPSYLLANHKSNNQNLALTIVRDVDSRPFSAIVAELDVTALNLQVTEQTLDFQSMARNSAIRFSGDASEIVEIFLGEYDDVRIDVTGSVLQLSGEIALSSLSRIQSSEMLASGFTDIDVTQLRIIPEEALEERAMTQKQLYQKLVASINSQAFYFTPNEAGLTEDDYLTLSRVVTQINRLLKLTEILSLPSVELLIIGFADQSGSVTSNQRISRERANLLRALLIENGISANIIVTWAAGHIDASSLDGSAQRRVILSVLDRSKDMLNVGANQ